MSQTSKQFDEMRLVSYCPVCETRSNAMQARMLGQAGETHLLHIQCQKCHNAFLSLVAVNQVGASSIGLLTDLSFEDVVRFHEQKAISVDDVISTHEFLENGNWTAWFEKPNKTQVLKTKKRVVSGHVPEKQSRKKLGK